MEAYLGHTNAWTLLFELYDRIGRISDQAQITIWPIPILPKETF